MYDVTAIGELLIDFAALSSDSAGYPTMKANPVSYTHLDVYKRQYLYKPPLI